MNPFASRRIKATHFAQLVKHADWPLGVRDPHHPRHSNKLPVPKEGASVLKVLVKLHRGVTRLKVHHGQYVTFHEVLMSLATRDFRLPKEGLGPSRFAAALIVIICRFRWAAPS